MFREYLHSFQDYLVQKRRLFVKVQHILVDTEELNSGLAL